MYGIKFIKHLTNKKTKDIVVENNETVEQEE